MFANPLFVYIMITGRPTITSGDACITLPIGYEVVGGIVLFKNTDGRQATGLGTYKADAMSATPGRVLYA